MPPLPKPKPKPKGPVPPGQAGGARHAKKPISKTEESQLQNEQAAGRRGSSPGKPQGKKSYLAKKGKRVRKIYSHPGAVKAEFLIALVLLLLSPIGNPDVKVDLNYFKKLVALMVLFMFLFPMGQSSNPATSRVASGLGGMLVLVLLVYAPSKGVSVSFTRLISTVVSKLQPK